MNYKSGTVSSNKYCFQIEKKCVISSFVLNNAIRYIFYTYIYTQYTTIYSVYSIQLYHYTFSFNFAKYDEENFYF